MKWPEVTLGDALATAEAFVDGDWVESKDQDPEGDVRLIQLADVGEGTYLDKSKRFLTASKARELKCTFLKKGDVLVARMPDPLGRACIFPGDPKRAVTVVDVCLIRPNGAGPDARWLMHWFNSPTSRSQIAGFATGTTRSRISRGNLSKLKLTLPPLPEQRRIAEILDKADALRAKRRAALAQLDTLTQSIFLDMFGDPARNSKRWIVRSLSDLGVEFRYGTSTKSAVDGKATLRIPNVVTGRIDLNDLKRVPVSGEEFERLRLRSGDLLFVRTNGNPESVGRCAVFDPNALQCLEHDFAEFIFASYLIRARVPDELSPIYVREHLSTREGRRRVRTHCKTSAGQYNLNVEGLGALTVMVPPRKLQEAFRDVAAKVDRVRNRLSAALSAADALFASLQHRAFRGEL